MTKYCLLLCHLSTQQSIPVRTLACPCPQNRVAVLTKIVERRIQPYVDGDKEGFRKEIQKEADRLAKTPFGVPLMHIIAYVPFPCQDCAVFQPSSEACMF